MKWSDESLGQYLHCGICLHITIENIPESMPQEESIALAESLVDTSLYERYGDDKESKVRLSLPDVFLEKHLVSFLERQYRYMQVKDSETEPVLMGIREAIAQHKIREFLENISSSYLNIVQDQGRFNDSWFRRGSISYKAVILAYIQQGKVFMEEYDLFLSYMLSLIRAQSDENPIAKTTMAFIG